MDGAKKEPVAAEIQAHYDDYDESQRLADGFGQLERVRTQELIERFLTDSPKVILDVGGAGGVYSFWMASLGHAVHLIDIVPKHIAEAAETAATLPHKLASMTVGDARSLQFPADFADLIIMHGPLYHLINPADRQQALAEAKRLLKPGGRLLAFAITRTAGLLYSIHKGLIFEPDYFEMIRGEIETGTRQNSPDWANTFISAYFHRPEELSSEIEAAGLIHEATLGVIGPAWQVPDLDRSWADPKKRAVLLDLARLSEHDPALGPRLLGVGRKAA